MYEARQNKEKVSRRIDVTGSGARQRMSKINLHAQQKEFDKSYLKTTTQFFPDEAKIKERAYFIWEKKGRPNQTQQEQQEDYYLARMEEIQKEQFDTEENKIHNEIDVNYPINIHYSNGIKKTIIIKGKQTENFEKFQIALSQAIPIWEDMSIDIPNGLEIYYTDVTGVSEAAYHFDNGKIIMTQTMFQKPKDITNQNIVRGGVSTVGALTGVSNQVSNSDIEHGAAILTHELGHILHKMSDHKEFGRMQSGKNNAVNGQIVTDVSYYAANSGSNLEFVAEVFTGLVHGIDFKSSTINEYLKLGGYPNIVRKRYPHLLKNK